VLTAPLLHDCTGCLGHVETDEERRVASWRAASMGGTKALTMAHGFEVGLLGKLVLDGRALATPHETCAGRRPMIVIWMTITEDGRKAITGQQANPSHRCPATQAALSTGLGMPVVYHETIAGREDNAWCQRHQQSEKNPEAQSWYTTLLNRP
jgi:hypothetical protein